LPPPPLLLLLLQVQPEFMNAADFKKKFIDPIKAGQERDATPAHKRTMTMRLSLLQTKTAVRGGWHSWQHLQGCSMSRVLGASVWSAGRRVVPGDCITAAVSIFCSRRL
jgi:hypothetical protein